MTTDVTLVHGYTLADIRDIARLAVHTARTLATGIAWHDRLDVAWSATVEALYKADEPPTRPELVGVGQRAILEAVDAHLQAHGYLRRKTDGTRHGPWSSPAFRVYWWDLSTVVPGPDAYVVERVALGQVWARLSPRDQATLAALAAAGDKTAAARAVGVAAVTFEDRLRAARQAAARLWHWPETARRTGRRLDHRCDRKPTARKARRRLVTGGAR